MKNKIAYHYVGLWEVLRKSMTFKQTAQHVQERALESSCQLLHQKMEDKLDWHQDCLLTGQRLER